jgi:thiol-disulfide isomerase/thioredoxin
VSAGRIGEPRAATLVLAMVLVPAFVSPARAQEPRKAPDYAARVLGSDATATLAELAGKVVLLNAFATWCAPCRAEMPDFAAVSRKLRDRGLEVVGVNVDEGEADAKVLRFVETLGIGFAVWRDPANRFSKKFRAMGVPETVLVGRDGVILHHWNGPMDPGEPENLEVIEAALSTGAALDHDELGSNRSKLVNVIDSKVLERDASGKPDSTFPHPALEAELPREDAAALRRGRRLAEQRGCLACHATEGGTGAGPAWSRLRGTEVTLDDGRRIARDSAYLARAVREPDAEIVAGYEKGVMAGAMPGKSLTDEEIEAIVRFLESL